MLVRPYRSDPVYDKMKNQNEASAQYQRDLALYEQAVALQKLTGENNISTSYTPYLIRATETIDKDTPEYEEALSIEKERDALSIKLRYLKNIIQLLKILIFIPLSFIWITLAINLKLTICLGITALVSMILIPIPISKANRIDKKIDELNDKLLDISNKYIDKKIKESNLKRYTRKKLSRKNKMYIKRKVNKQPYEVLDLTK